MTKKLEKLYLKNLRNSEHFQFHKLFIALLLEFNGILKKVQALFDTYTRLVDDEDVALKKIVKSRLTDKIFEADSERDNLYGGLLNANRAALRHFSSDVREAAENVKIVLNSYGNPTQKSYNEETSIIYNLLQDLSGKYRDDVKTAGLLAWVAELEKSNLAIEQLMKERRDEAATLTELAMKECRAKADDAYRAMLKRLEALVEIEGEAEYAELIRKHNLDIDKFSVTLARRTTKKTKDEERP